MYDSCVIMANFEIIFDVFTDLYMTQTYTESTKLFDIINDVERFRTETYTSVLKAVSVCVNIFWLISRPLNFKLLLV